MSESAARPTPELKHLWEPLDIGPTRVKHRIMQTAQTVNFGDDHVLGEKHIATYTERAKGGTALLITEQQAGHPLSKGSFSTGCSAHDKRAIVQYAKLAEAIAPHGAPARVPSGVDSVVLSMMKSPVDGLYFAVRDQHPEVHRVGDAVDPRRLEAVMYEAEQLGREI